MKKINKKSGFTLFELLVSISIIAILTAIAVVSFGGLNKKTRDARRTSDLEKIRLSLEAARQTGGTYPDNLSSLVGASLLDSGPVDPKGVGYSYNYEVGTSGFNYVLCAQMEDIGSTNISISDNCGTNKCGSGNNCNYRVRNP